MCTFILQSYTIEMNITVRNETHSVRYETLVPYRIALDIGVIVHLHIDQLLRRKEGRETCMLRKDWKDTEQIQKKKHQTGRSASVHLPRI